MRELSERKVPRERDLPILYFGEKGDRLAEIRLIAKDKPGVFAMLTSFLMEAGVDIKNTYAVVRKKGTVGKIVLFADLTKSRLTIEELREKLEKMDFIAAVEVNAAQDSIVASTEFPIVVEGIRSLVIPTSVLVRFINDVHVTLEENAPAVLMMIGQAFGRSVCDMIRHLLGEVKDPMLFLTIFKNIALAFGWFKIEYEDFDFSRGEGNIIVRDSFEAQRKALTGKGCHLTKGMLTTVLSEATGYDVEVEELECAIEGSPYCLFACKPFL